MSEQLTQAAPSPAAPETESFEIPRSGTPEYADWRLNGKVQEKQPKPAETAPADTSKETASDPERGENAPGTEPGKSTQESRRKPGAEARIAELTARAKALERELEEARKPKPAQADPTPSARPVPQYTRPKPTPEDKGPDGNPKYSTYEDYVEELADWKAEQRIAQRDQQAAVAEAQKSVSQKLEEARKRYENFDSVALPLVPELMKPDIPREVLAVLNDSPVLADLLYTIGGSEVSKADFLAACRNNPSKALRVALLMEQEIQAELAKGHTEPAGRNERGQFTAQPGKDATPAKKGPENAPEPPIEIGNRGAAPMDEAARALQAVERGDNNAFRAWKQAEDAKALRRRRGA